MPIAQAVLFLKHGQTDRQTDASERYTRVSGYTAGVCNKVQSEHTKHEASIRILAHRTQKPTCQNTQLFT